MENTNLTTAIRFIRIRAVCEKTGLSKSSIYDLMTQGRFPQTVRLSEAGRCVAFVESEIDDWMASRIAARNVAA
ncbi:DNA-binding protein [Aeromonas caviae]|nr:DNA-binding protein [Aeromonas caviae]GJB04215.1 DNA-binding protein [Aeromonas caviae]GKR70793.1 DNA-binding protein [Aeromonas caviae]